MEKNVLEAPLSFSLSQGTIWVFFKMLEDQVPTKWNHKATSLNQAEVHTPQVGLKVRWINMRKTS